MKLKKQLFEVTSIKTLQSVYRKETHDLPYNLFSCADIILGFMPKMSYVNYGRNYFPRGQNVSDLGNGIQLWSGSVMAVKPGGFSLSRLYVCLFVCSFRIKLLLVFRVPFFEVLLIT